MAHEVVFVLTPGMIICLWACRNQDVVIEEEKASFLFVLNVI